MSLIHPNSEGVKQEKNQMDIGLIYTSVAVCF